MTSPNKANIDQWLFDYFEGNLNPIQEELLEEFLLEHPEYDPDMEAWGGARATSGIYVYPGAERLKRPAILFPLFMKWASVIVMLLGVGGAIYLINTQFAKPDYTFVNLHELYYDQLEKELANSDIPVASLVSTSSLDENNSVLVADNNENLATNSSRGSSHITSSNTTVSSSQPLMNNVAGVIRNNAPQSELESAVHNPLKIQPILNVPPVQVDEVNYSELNSASVNSNKSDAKSKNSLMNDISRSVKRFVRSDLGLINLRDPQYMVPGMTQNDMNFGHTGSLLATRVYSNTFVQWPDRAGQTVATQLGVDSYVSSLHGGVGFQMNYSNYESGMFENYEGAVTYSPKFKVADNVLIEPSLRFKMGSRNLESSRIIPGSQIEWERNNVRTIFPDGESPQGERLFYRDLGVGMLVNTKWAFLGVNVDNLGRHHNDIYTNPGSGSLSRAPLNYVITAGTDYESFNKRTSLSTYLVYQNYGSLNKGWLGVNFRYRFMTVGGALSTALDPVASIGLSFDHFRIAYMTDYSMNNLTGNRMLSHQLSLRFVTKPAKNSRKLVY